MRKPLTCSFREFVQNAVLFYHAKKKMSYEEISVILNDMAIELQNYVEVEE